MLELTQNEFTIINTFVNEVYLEIDFEDQPEEYKSAIKSLIEKLTLLSDSGER